MEEPLPNNTPVKHPIKGIGRIVDRSLCSDKWGRPLPGWTYSVEYDSAPFNLPKRDFVTSEYIDRIPPVK